MINVGAGSADEVSGVAVFKSVGIIELHEKKR
jgi:hypothetical protein